MPHLEVCTEQQLPCVNQAAAKTTRSPANAKAGLQGAEEPAGKRMRINQLGSSTAAQAAGQQGMHSRQHHEAAGGVRSAPGGTSSHSKPKQQPEWQQQRHDQRKHPSPHAPPGTGHGLHGQQMADVGGGAFNLAAGLVTGLSLQQPSSLALTRGAAPGAVVTNAASNPPRLPAAVTTGSKSSGAVTADSVHAATWALQQEAAAAAVAAVAASAAVVATSDTEAVAEAQSAVAPPISGCPVYAAGDIIELRTRVSKTNFGAIPDSSFSSQVSWSYSGEVFKLRVLEQLGKGGNGKVFKVELVHHTEAAGGEAVAGAAGIAMSTDAEQDEGQDGNDEIKQPGSLMALKVPCLEKSFTTAECASLPSLLRYAAACNNLQFEHNVMKMLEQCYCTYAMRSYAYGHAVKGGGHVPGVLMQLANGGSVQQLLCPDPESPEKVHPMTAEEAWSVVRDVVNGLNDVHTEAKMVYGDIKPSNILFSRPVGGGQRYYSLCDFGSCRKLPALGGAVSDCPGTQAYSSPEKLLNTGSYTIKVDTFGVGCLLLHLRTGLPPFPHLMDMPDQQAAVCRTYDEVVACKLYDHLEGIELDFLKGSLVLDPEQRPELQVLLMHDYLTLGPAGVQQVQEAVPVSSSTFQRVAALYATKYC